MNILSTFSSNSSDTYPIPIRIALDLISMFNSRTCSEGYGKELSDDEEKTLRLVHKIIRQNLKQSLMQNNKNQSNCQQPNDNELIVGILQ